ncbi:MAG: hypothetical protein ACR2PY_02485 [Salinispira sp.]
MFDNISVLSTYFSSVEYNLKHKKNVLSDASQFYMNKVSESLASLITVCSQIMQSKKKKGFSPDIIKPANTLFFHDIRKVVNYNSENSHEIIGSAQIKRTITLLKEKNSLTQKYLDNPKDFFETVENGKIHELIDFISYMKELYSPHMGYVETSYEKEPRISNYAQL